MVSEASFPEFYPVRQLFEDRSVDDVAHALRRSINETGLLEKLPRGKRGIEVAITAGSRGIDGIAEILREAGRVIRDAGSIKPFIVPAMGSHGGATADGQVTLLAEMGMTEKSVGMPIRSSMETVEVARTLEGVPVCVDKSAFSAGGILIINRVKPHTTVTGPHGSGIVKMLAVGLGNRDGAVNFHRNEPAILGEIMVHMAEEILMRLPIIGGIGLVEDGFDRIALVEAAKPENFFDVDRELLGKAAQWMPRLPFDELDVLVVDEMGKDISGTGMDTNVIGRSGINGVPDPAFPSIKHIVALALSDATKGNAHGVGMADFVTDSLVESIDRQVTLENAQAARFPEKALIPPSFPTGAEAVQAALSSCPDPANVRMARIRNTRHLETMLVSEALIPLVKANKSLEITGGPQNLFDGGRLN